MKKIGICTLYFANNYGAVLQAFALQEVLKEMGHDVEFIKVRDIQINMQQSNADLFEKSRKYYNIFFTFSIQITLKPSYKTAKHLKIQIILL